MARKRRARPPSATDRETIAKQQAEQRSFEALNLMRTRGLSRAEAARRAGVSIATMHRHVGSALTQRKDGRYVATAFDRLPRTLRFLTPKGQIDLTVRDSRIASVIATYMTAVNTYLTTGDRRALAPYRDHSVRTRAGTFPFITDARTLERLAYAGEVSFEDLYAMTTGETK